MMNTRIIDRPTLLEQVIDVRQQAEAAILDVYTAAILACTPKATIRN